MRKRVLKFYWMKKSVCLQNWIPPWILYPISKRNKICWIGKLDQDEGVSISILVGFNVSDLGWIIIGLAGPWLRWVRGCWGRRGGGRPGRGTVCLSCSPGTSAAQDTRRDSSQPSRRRPGRSTSPPRTSLGTRQTSAGWPDSRAECWLRRLRTQWTPGWSELSYSWGRSCRRMAECPPWIYFYP